jgi:thymidylate synthase (FAD)
MEPITEIIKSDLFDYTARTPDGGIVGEVHLIDCMPGYGNPEEYVTWKELGSPLDHRVINVARRSYGAGTKRSRKDKDLLRFLIRHKHTSPVEHVKFTFDITAPLFVARQIFRHRMANYNEKSFRYSQAGDDFFYPATLHPQSKDNRQCTNFDVSLEESDTLMKIFNESVGSSFESYNQLIDGGVSREIARCVLPASTMTSWVMTIDAHNLLHFLKLRTAPDAQAETVAIANRMLMYLELTAPWLYSAFQDYYKESITMTAIDLKVHRYIYTGALRDYLPHRKDEVVDRFMDTGDYSRREIKESVDKIVDNFYVET